MQTYSKAIGAAVGGIAGGAGAVTGTLMLPDGSPWYAYVLMTLISALIPALTTYLAKPNA